MTVASRLYLGFGTWSNSTERTASRQPSQGVQVVAEVQMSYRDRTERHSLRFEDIQLNLRQGPTLGMGRDRAPGREVGASHRSHDGLLRRMHDVQAGTELCDATSHAAEATPSRISETNHERELVDAAVADHLCRIASFVEPCRGDDVHIAVPAELRQTDHVPAVVRSRQLDDRASAGGAECLQIRDDLRWRVEHQVRVALAIATSGSVSRCSCG